MLQIAIVALREILEIALIVGILITATRDISGRTKWILGGLILGIAGSIIITFFTDNISESLDGNGQEFFNGLILLAASFMITWTILWMQKHAKLLSGELKKISHSVRDGKKPLYTLLVVVLLSTLREGTEIVLFTYSYYISGVSIGEIICGLVIGISLGCAAGLAIYFGILKTFGKYFFPVTTWILVFLSAGIAASGIGFWVNAAIVPALGNPIFDSSAIISQQSFFGELLHLFFGYIDRPTGSQLIAYILTIIFLIVGLRIAKRI